MIISLKKIQKATENLIRDFDPEKVILFGSFAWGKPTEDSDVDLFIIKNTTGSTRELAREIDGSIFPRPFPLDILVYTSKQVETRKNMGDDFIINILERGKVLYAK